LAVKIAEEKFMHYLFPTTIPTVSIINSAERFPVHRIYCVGRNYADHVREMGNDPSREPPVFFSKPADALVSGDASIPFPSRTNNLHHEIELVVALNADASEVSVVQALDCVYGYAVGIDLTRRDLQVAAKTAGQPWDIAKGFDNSAPVSAIVPASVAGHPHKGAIQLKVNGELRQQGDLADMIWSVAEIIAELSTYYQLRAGDLIFTGTPAGVGKLVTGDVVEGSIQGVGNIKLTLN
jgi:fumarylpyruvate hydrolase